MVAAPVALPVLITVIPNMQLAETRNGFGRIGRQVQIIESLSSKEAQVLASAVVPGY